MKKININDHVKVKLTDLGKDIFYHQFDELNNICREVVIKPMYPKVDADGFTEFQLLDLMSIYGAHLQLGCNIPFENCAIYFDDDLEDVEC